MRVFMIIFASFIVAILLTIFPLPSWLMWLRPIWVGLIIIYWALTMPYQVGVGIAFLIGLILDFLQGTPIGEHAFALTLMTFLVLRFYNRIQSFPTWQRLFAVFGLILFYQLMIFLVEGSLGRMPRYWQFWVPVVTSMIFWPWVSSILRSCQRRFKIMPNDMASFV